MKVLFIAAESSPFVKIGGLGDVIGSLPRYLKDEKVDARVVMPLYSSIDRDKFDIEFVKYIYVDIGWKHIYCGIFQTKYQGVRYYFIDNEQYFNRNSVYGQFDDGERFAFFSRAALEIMSHIDFRADIVHANDWHTALSIVYLDSLKKSGNEFYLGMKGIFSIHNVEFQGRYDRYLLGSLFGLGDDYLNNLVFDGDINLLKGAVQLADGVNTVSENYARELLDPYFSFGLSSIFNAEKNKIKGIVNGLDFKKFNPETDKNIYNRFSKENFSDKIKNKLAFQKEMSLEMNPEIPLIGMVTRLTDQKGIELVIKVYEEILNMGSQLVILGTGDQYFEQKLREMEYARHDRLRSIIMFSGKISSQIYSSSDLFLMPSKSEPCGLSQLIAMRYGAIPVVNRVGGLRDTVQPFDIDTKTGTGFTFESFNEYDMLDAIKRALDVYYYDKSMWEIVVSNAMKFDSSWSIPTKEYIKMYKEVLNKD